MGLCYETLGDIPTAIEYLERAFAIDEQLGRLEGQAAALGNLGFIAVEHGTPEQARDYLTHALTLYRRMGLPEDHPNIAMVNESLAKLP